MSTPMVFLVCLSFICARICTAQNINFVSRTWCRREREREREREKERERERERERKREKRERERECVCAYTCLSV